jgi:hypothetical protein
MTGIRFLALVVVGVVALGQQAQSAEQTSREMVQTVGRIVTADIFEAANYATEKCPGVRIDDDGVEATIDEEGITDDVYTSDQWKMFELRGQSDARTGYAKNPSEWCERIWKLLGPDHPPMIKHQLLVRH